MRDKRTKKKPLMYSKQRTIILLELKKVEYQLKDLKLFAKRRANQFFFSLISVNEENFCVRDRLRNKICEF